MTRILVTFTVDYPTRRHQISHDGDDIAFHKDVKRIHGEGTSLGEGNGSCLQGKRLALYEPVEAGSVTEVPHTHSELDKFYQQSKTYEPLPCPVTTVFLLEHKINHMGTEARASALLDQLQFEPTVIDKAVSARLEAEIVDGGQLLLLNLKNAKFWKHSVHKVIRSPLPYLQLLLPIVRLSTTSLPALVLQRNAIGSPAISSGGCIAQRYATSNKIQYTSPSIRLARPGRSPAPRAILFAMARGRPPHVRP
jgi:hypothetical protein